MGPKASRYPSLPSEAVTVGPKALSWHLSPLRAQLEPDWVSFLQPMLFWEPDWDSFYGASGDLGAGLGLLCVVGGDLGAGLEL